MLVFESVPPDFAQATLNLPNPLDKRITPPVTLMQPEGSLTQGTPRLVRYDIVIPPKLFKKLKDESAKPADQQKKIQANISVFWGAGGDNISIYGLTYFFKDSEDTILVTVEGFEDRGSQGAEPKNSGFHKEYLKKLIDELKTAFSTVKFDLLETRITIISGYSTGFGGMGQSVNNDFFDLTFIERMIFFDCLYRADGPPVPKGESPPPLLPEENNPGADEIDPGHSQSAFNSRRAIIKIQKAQELNVDNRKKEQQKIEDEKKEVEKLPDGPDKDKKLKDIEERLNQKGGEIQLLQNKKLTVIAYTVTMGGSPKYKNVAKGKYPYTVFVPVLIDLREQNLQNALFVLSITRALDAAKRASIITEGEIPQSYRQFIPSLPKRGDIRSGDAAKKGTLKTLKEWDAANSLNLFYTKAATTDLLTAIGIISDKKLFYGSGYPDRTNAAGMLHIGHLVEFGGEFIV